MPIPMPKEKLKELLTKSRTNVAKTFGKNVAKGAKIVSEGGLGKAMKGALKGGAIGSLSKGLGKQMKKREEMSEKLKKAGGVMTESERQRAKKILGYKK